MSTQSERKRIFDIARKIAAGKKVSESLEDIEKALSLIEANKQIWTLLKTR